MLLAALLAVAGFQAVSDGWELRRIAPDTPSCRAVKRGASADIQLLRNRENKLVLIAGHPDWSYDGDIFPATIRIDGGAPVTLDAFPLGPVVLMKIEDPALDKRLRAGRTLDLTLGERQAHADITGLGKAFDAIAVCPG